ncbi:hypothetical protein VP01_4934g2 [Puccinia sorghi]|uniref:SWIM-type domain-containing protein n=1 Tax=Puccinia sorghi TaxID=27349 RepID=A0A0L6UM20_9BASI|nr:hypothetical protein VP01_4934g2 [Puccinia sorghi]
MFERIIILFSLLLFEKESGSHKPQMTQCPCLHYSRFGSGCKHIYYLGCQHNMMIVEKAGGTIK